MSERLKFISGFNTLKEKHIEAKRNFVKPHIEKKSFYSRTIVTFYPNTYKRLNSQEVAVTKNEEKIISPDTSNNKSKSTKIPKLKWLLKGLKFLKKLVRLGTEEYFVS